MARAIVLGDLERRHLRHRILRAIGLGGLLGMDDVDRDVLVRQLLEIEADPHAVARRAAPVVVKDDLHDAAPAATTCWSITPNGLAPLTSASIRIRSPTAMNGVAGLPLS